MTTRPIVLRLLHDKGSPIQFKQFADIINAKFMEMSSKPLFIATASKDLIWSSYLESYPEGTNDIFRERTEHDCQTCRSFIKRIGSVVSINDDYTLDSIWNVQGLQYPYDVVASTLHNLIVSSGISSIFVTDEALAGREFNIEQTEVGDIRWDHFYATIPASIVRRDGATYRGNIETQVSLFKRALSECTPATVDTALDLCESIYRGEEFLPTVSAFRSAVSAFLESGEHPNFAWKHYIDYPARIRNTAIGTLLIDIAEGTDLDTAVSKYEAVVAPANYKRTSAIVTPRMKENAIATIDSLGLRDSLPRRHAVLEDISVSDVLYANGDAQQSMKDPLLSIMSTPRSRVASSGRSVTEVSIDTFISQVLPNSRRIEAIIENRHTPNLVSLVAPEYPDSPNMLKWDNNFSWSYYGEVTDSMKERVKSAGGKVDGVLRFSIQWNEDREDYANDLDAHCHSPTDHIYYNNRTDRYSGELDVDIRLPGNNTAVENITWSSLSSMKDGEYKFSVHNYSGRNTGGFRAEIEFNGQTFEYDYSSSVDSHVYVATVTLKDGIFTIEHHLPSSASSREVWGIHTLQYHPISTIMLSPNHWNGQSEGNKHYFFFLEGCKNPNPVRGFYNEFLDNKLQPHRKVFEVLSSNMKCLPSDSQLSGVGFSSTQRNDITVRVDGRPYKIIF